MAFPTPPKAPSSRPWRREGRGSRSSPSAPVTPTATTWAAWPAASARRSSRERRARPDVRAYRADDRRGRPRLAGAVMTQAAPVPSATEPHAFPRPPATPGLGQPAPGLRPGLGRRCRCNLWIVSLCGASPGGIGLRSRRPGGPDHRRVDRVLPVRLGSVSRRCLAQAGPRGVVGRAGGRPRRGPRAGARRAGDRPLPRRSARSGLFLVGPRPGHRPGPGAGRPLAPAPDLRPDRRRTGRLRGRLLLRSSCVSLWAIVTTLARLSGS